MNLSIREKANRVRRQHILEAATRVFAERGYDRATVRAVAKAAGIADGTVYNYFENKEALLLAVLDSLDRVDGLAKRPLPAPERADAAQVVTEMLRERWKDFTPEKLLVLRPVFSEMLVNVGLRQTFLRLVIQPAVDLPLPYFRKLAKLNKMAGAEPEFTLRLMTACFLGLVTLKLLGDEHLDANWDVLPDKLADTLLHGILPRGRPKQIRKKRGSRRAGLAGEGGSKR